MVDDKKLNNMFLINAPAGSGKTTYIENEIFDLIAKFPNRKILAITFTNRAKDELKNRIDNKNVTIDTIHSFLSNFIKIYFSKSEVLNLYFDIYNKKIKEAIINATEESKQKYIDKYGKFDFETVKQNIKTIYYNEQPFSTYYYGGLSHKDIIIFARKMFENFPKLKKRLTDKYSYIFIDEYQDTFDDVLWLFYNSVLETNTQLILLGDKMQEIYENYEGTFNKNFDKFNQEKKLEINYRCSKKIVDVLNNLYNDKKYNQQTFYDEGNKPILLITNDFHDSILKYKNYMCLYLFNKERFEEINAKELYDAVCKISEYGYYKKNSVVDVLTKNSTDNPDKMFRILFCICKFAKLIQNKSYGDVIQFAKKNKDIFDYSLTDISFHNDKIVFYRKIMELIDQYESTEISIKEFCDYLIDEKFCNEDLFDFAYNNSEYDNMFEVPFLQFRNLNEHLEKPFISTQHGVKGEGYDKICFIAEESKNNPIVYMYDFFRLYCTKDINLTGFQEFYYDYNQELKKVDYKSLDNKDLFEPKKEEYLKMAKEIKEKYINNKYFSFFELDKYENFIKRKNVTNGKKCFKINKVKGALWAYKLFYVGCSRAKKELVVIVDSKKISDFEKVFKEKMKSIGFEILCDK